MSEIKKLASENAFIDCYLKQLHLSLARILYNMARSSDPEPTDEMLDLMVETSQLLKEIVPNDNPYVLSLATSMYLESFGDMTEQEFRNMEDRLFRDTCRKWIAAGVIKDKIEFVHIWDESKEYLKRVEESGSTLV